MVSWIFTKRKPLSAVFGSTALAFVVIASIVVVSQSQSQDGKQSQPNDTADVGGIVRPLRDIQEMRISEIKADRTNSDQEARGREREAALPKQAALALADHPTIARVHATIKKGESDSLSIHSEAPEFDFEKFKSAKAEHLDQYLPNRMYQCAQPGENVPALAPIAASWQQMKSGESVRLEVKTSAGYPVTFVATDLGAFQNKLNAVTVEANERGAAWATYTATPGTIGRSHVIVGSPGASGQVKFEMLISPIQN